MELSRRKHEHVRSGKESASIKYAALAGDRHFVIDHDRSGEGVRLNGEVKKAVNRESPMLAQARQRSAGDGQLTCHAVSSQEQDRWS
jgi:hypothetical protein